MKILFSVGELENNLTATTKIVAELSEHMAQKGHIVQIAGTCTTSHSDTTTKSGVTYKHMHPHTFIMKSNDAFEKFIAESGESRNRARKQFIKKHPLYSVGLFVKYHPLYVKRIDEPRFVNQLNSLLAEFKPDALIAVCKPVNKFELALLADSDIPSYAYQLDPWGLHHIDNPEGDTEIIKKEIAVFDRCKHIFTTPILLEQYSNNILYSGHTEKMTAVEFPNLKEFHSDEKISSAIDFDEEHINILFTGIVSDEFRSPESILKKLSFLFDKKEKVRVYFMGSNYSESLNSYIERYPDNVFFYNHVDTLTATATMNKADILLNISNAIDNQVPSKIFDYFSFGKPIINVQKISNCPTRRYFDRYPLAITYEDFNNNSSTDLQSFICNSKGKKMSYDEVYDIFYAATPEYVSQHIIDIISK